ncbi:glycosyl hydrolase [Prolixibacteraceae bacterium Z1-6]|uniref:Glycosyl hydrolase n=1 Tax=Draconibacterium aestuarii TaxID=2998507 RepID=A0A9X3FDE4_9BACT|nr:glycosyl hydrolase [Prolixibacteraceae bacterium Z1-6]
MKIYFASIFVLFIVFSGVPVKGQKSDDYQSVKNNFLNPPQSARPKVYWWCLNGNIDTVRAKQELRAMKDAGITGFDLFEIGVPPSDTMIPGGPAFMSDKSLQLIKFAVDEAGKLGMTVGLNLASSWNAGGNWVKPEHGGKSLYSSKVNIKGNAQSQKIKLPFPEVSFPEESLIGGNGETLIPFRKDGRPEYYEEIAVLAIPAEIEEGRLDTTDIIDITPFFDPETDELNWNAPDGNWEICRYVCSNSGQQVVRPSPLSAGLTIDHFDSTAVETHLMYFINRLQPVLGDFRETALQSLYLASYEARGFVWTSTLPEEFKKVNGYNIQKFIPSFFNPELFKEETAEKIQTDFKKTLSELMINNLYKKSQEICNRYGLKINSEAGGPGYPLYNGPAEPLKAQGSIDIPRGEFWINHSRFYKDGNDSIDILRVVKEAAAASHIYEKGIVEEEAFTSFMHWQEGPFDMKPFGDRAFCEGMNRVVFHGFSHNISNSGFPGYVYNAGTHFNDKRAWWPNVKPFTDYVSRISAVFQETNFKADVVWYYGDKVPNSATSKNTHFKVGPGYDYEVINTEILLDKLSVKNGKLILSNGAEFSLLALEDEGNLNSNVLKKLDELAKQGAVIIGEKPGKVDGVVAKNENKILIDNLWDSASGLSQNNLSEKGKIYYGISSLQMLHILGIQPDIDYSGRNSDLIDFIHFNKNELDFYFIRNTQNEWLSRNINFRQKNKSPEIWDPVSGKILPVYIYNQEGEYVNLPLTLPPYGACLVVFRKSSLPPQFTGISETNPPLFEYTTNGINFLQEGSFILEGSKQSLSVQNNIETNTIDGPWDVEFTKGWGAPEKTTFPELISWTDSPNDGIKYYSGTATYKKSFHYEKNKKTGNESIYLDLGEISKVADVWLNGKHLGISWAKPHRFDVTNSLSQGKNTITVEVANVWSNRLTGDAVTGQKFTNTNINTTIVPAATLETGDQTRYPWAEVPLIKSGLLGPVTIQSISPVAIK